MSWQEPTFLLLLLLVPLLLLVTWWAWRRYRSKRVRYFSDELFSRLAAPRWKAGERLRTVCFYAGIALLVLALAGPLVGTEVREVQREGMDLMVVLDLSRSMLAEDVLPNRLEKVRHELSRLPDHLQNDRIGLIVFTGQALVQAPLTRDYASYRDFLSIAETDMMPTTTTDFSAALERTLESFEAMGESSGHARVVLFVSDGEDHGPAFESALDRMEEENIHIYTAGVGTREGGPIPVYSERTGGQTGYHQDRTGERVITRLEPQTLQRMADRTQGAYYEISGSQDNLDAFIEQIADRRQSAFGTEQITDYRNHYQLVGALGLLFIVLSLGIPGYKPLSADEKPLSEAP